MYTNKEIIKSIKEDFSNDDLNKLKDAIYMISDARSMLSEIKEALKTKNKWGRVGELAHTIDELDELMGKEEGCGLSNYYKVL
jgi:hypothetical protein